MDDDVMGFTVGYSSGDAFDHAEAPDYAPTGRADYLTFLWSGHVQGPPSPSVHGCSAYEPPGEYAPNVSTLSRSRGQPTPQERGVGTFDISSETPQNPGCDASAGDEVLARLDLPGLDNVSPGGLWYLRAVASNEANAGRPRDTYLFTIDYRPERLRVWLDGTLIAAVEPSVDPFPPGGPGEVHFSPGGVRPSASPPEPSLPFDPDYLGPVALPPPP